MQTALATEGGSRIDELHASDFRIRGHSEIRTLNAMSRRVTACALRDSTSSSEDEFLGSLRGKRTRCMVALTSNLDLLRASFLTCLTAIFLSRWHCTLAGDMCASFLFAGIHVVSPSSVSSCKSNCVASDHVLMRPRKLGRPGKGKGIVWNLTASPFGFRFQLWLGPRDDHRGLSVDVIK